jgi:DNA repair exonuclease SbcCD ATPase subunit
MENKLTPEEFLKLHLFGELKYAEIAEQYNVQVKTLSQWWDDLAEMRERINKAKRIYNNKKGKPEAAGLADPETFFNWYDPREKKCCYCGIEEYKLEKIFDAGILSSNSYSSKQHCSCYK